MEDDILILILAATDFHSRKHTIKDLYAIKCTVMFLYMNTVLYLMYSNTDILP